MQQPSSKLKYKEQVEGLERWPAHSIAVAPTSAVLISRAEEVTLTPYSECEENGGRQWWYPSHYNSLWLLGE
jgi:hypothetical protein